MGPVVVTCSGCGVQIRIAKPETALERSCPRCSTPLITALGKVFDPDPPVETPAAVEPRSKSNRAWLGAAMALAIVVPPLTVFLNHASESAGGPEPVPVTSAPAPARPAAPSRLEVVEGPPPSPVSTALSVKVDPQVEPAGEVKEDEPPRPDPSVFDRSPLTPPTVPRRPVAVHLPDDRAPEPRPADPAPERPRPQGAPALRLPRYDAGDARRIRIKTPSGEVVVGRVYGHAPDGETSVLLPDGQIGFTSGMAEADEPFRPATFDQMRDALKSSGPFVDFQVRQSAHYLVLYQSTPTFAEASIKLLEDLYKNLSEAFRKRKMDVHEPEFPLVAIIFRSERDFRAHKKVAPDVQAYYEILSNRIYFYQKSERDQHSPEVAALRKPQTVAHEGTHQILQNIGIHPRLSNWPLWLVEGLAEYCSSSTMTKKGAVWGGLGMVNPLHMATIHDLDDPASLAVKGSGRQRVGRDRRTPLVEYLITRSDLTPTDYALSWALTHYLAMKRGTDFLAFLRTMGQLPPLEKRTPADHLEAFRAAFGADLTRMDKAVATHLSKLKYDPLPYYAVMFEQPLGRGQVRRATIVSQSPSMIRQWIEEVTEPNGGTPVWDVFPQPTRSRAMLTAEQWMGSH